jgi:hypothetical protein
MHGIRLAALALCLAAPPAQAETRAIIELFTSQGCSSCPPADRLMGELAKDPSLVAISLNVDYWDSLGWKDTLADPRHTARQRAYALARGDRAVYTPQIVINGTAHLVGSDRDALRRALGGDAARPSIPVNALVVDGNLRVQVAASGGAGELWVVAVAREVAVTVARGENRGRRISYHNVARRWLKLGDWNGKAATWSVPVAQLTDAGADMAAVILQGGSEARPGAMLGGATAALR